MDVSTLSVYDLYGYVGVPVKLELNINDHPICGNVYTIDPESHSVVLMQFDKEDSNTPKKLLLIPGSTIKLLHELRDDELLPGCIQCTSEAIEVVDKIIRNEAEPSQSTEDEAAIEDRLKRLTELLSSKHVPFSKDDNIIRIGPVRIERPYRANNLLSDNALALQRTQKMLTDILK